MLASAHITTVYFITKNCRIHSIGGDWNAHAEENHAFQLSADSVVNTLLWEYFTEPFLIHTYHTMVDHVFKTGEPVTVPFRGDSPGWRRTMKLRILRSNHDLCEFICSTQDAEPREWVRLLDVTAERSSYWLPMCSWCKQVGVDETRWLEVEEAQFELEESECVPYPNLVHAVCPDCQVAIGELIPGNEKRSRHNTRHWSGGKVRMGV